MFIDIGRSRELNSAPDNPGPDASPYFKLIYERDVSDSGTKTFRCTPYRLVDNRRAGPDNERSHNVSFGMRGRNENLRPRDFPLDFVDQEGNLPVDLSEGDDSVANPFDTTKLPLELFEHIVHFVSRSDIKNMRLVNKNFEAGVSSSFFHTVVLPFTASIYDDLLATESPNSSVKAKPDVKGKGKCRDAAGSSLSQNEISSRGANRTPKNLNVFGEFGSHIKRYAMSFEVTEQQLLEPVTKAIQQEHEEFWGKYGWPLPQYHRFPDRAGLEDVADETSTMRSAFSNLKQVKHLALSINAGLGWLSGPDLSIRSRILQRLAQPFQPTNHSTDFSIIAQRRLWLTLEAAYKSVDCIDHLKQGELVRMEGGNAKRHLGLQQGRTGFPIPGTFLNRLEPIVIEEDHLGEEMDYPKEELRPGNSNDENLFNDHDNGNTHKSSGSSPLKSPVDLDTTNTIAEAYSKEPACKWNPHSQTKDAVSLTAGAGAESSITPDSGFLLCRMLTEFRRGPASAISNPNHLSQSQKEWLMETVWAQDAFLSSYLLSIADNPIAFRGVKTLTLSPLSSRHLGNLQRADFWEALRSLSGLEIKVMPDWREVYQESGNLIDTPAIYPSVAINELYKLLGVNVSPLKNLKNVSFGWAAGGEHAEGIMARNKHLLAAPLTTRDHVLSAATGGLKILVLPHAESITLSNCWVTPNALEGWIKHHVKLSLKKLTLDSVSLTAYTQSTRNDQAIPAVILQQQYAAAHQALLNLPQSDLSLNTPLPASSGGYLATSAGQNRAASKRTPEAVPFVWAGHTHNAWLDPRNPSRTNPTPVQLHNPAYPERLREGSWPEVLSSLRLSLHALHSPTLELVLLSCGYVRLTNPPFDQSSLIASTMKTSDDDKEPTWDPPFLHDVWWIQRRLPLLNDRLMRTDDNLLGALIPAVTANEMANLHSQWGLEEGWPGAELLGAEYDDDDGWGRWGWRTAEAATYDGHYRGGLGRFSGRIASFSDVDLRGTSNSHSKKATPGIGDSDSGSSDDEGGVDGGRGGGGGFGLSSNLGDCSDVDSDGSIQGATAQASSSKL